MLLKSFKERKKQNYDMYGTVYGIPSQLLKSGVRKMECMIDQNNDAVRLIRDERDHAGAIAILNRILLLVFHHDLENHDASTTSTTNTIPGASMLLLECECPPC